MSFTLLIALSLLQSPGAGFKEFIGRDLRKLGLGELAKLNLLCEKTLPKEKKSGWSEPEPYWIKPYHIGKIRWLFLKVYPGYLVPDVSYVRAYGLDENLGFVKRYEFATGYRLSFTKEQLATDKWFVQPVLSILVSSVGPFFVEKGKPAKPAFHPESGIRQFYTFDESGVYLVRMETGGNELLSSGYANGTSFIGPEVANRSLQEWTADLNSADTGRQLSALIWLGGTHLNSKDWRKKGYARETVEDSKTYETMRADMAIRTRIKELGQSSNPWLQKQAALSLKNLAQPLADTTDPPG